MQRQQVAFWNWVLAATLLVPSAESAAADCGLDANPACSTAINLGALPGDTGTQSLVRTGTGEAHFLVTVREESSSTRALTASVVLAVPPDVDCDLIVRCNSCALDPERQRQFGVLHHRRTQLRMSAASRWS